MMNRSTTNVRTRVPNSNSATARSSDHLSIITEEALAWARHAEEHSGLKQDTILRKAVESLAFSARWRLHHFSILELNGFERTTAAALFIPLGIVTATSNLGAGMLLDRYGPRLLLAGMLLLFGAMLALVPLVSSLPAVWLYGSVFGIVQGMQGAIMGSAYAYYFGRDHIGAIKGFAKTIFVAGTALGPLVYAGGFELVGNYTSSLVLSASLPVAVSVAALLSGRKT